ncbi:MAG: prepilin-type N-terminal cleavage/methylation domain-containing protein [Acidobacteriia bacterium]|nr:prepilin-type N-terminal cleavage/methylation domain-containing protein [Terriglobia bacterium]
MKTNSKQPQAGSPTFRARQRQAGFTLYELLVAMAVFLVIGGAAVRMFRAHVPLVSSSQDQAGLNMAMRSVVAQMQIDVVNAGAGFDRIPQQPWSLGATVVNNVAGAACNNPVTFSYGPNCFDAVNIIAADPGTSVAIPSDATGALCVDTSSSDLYLTPAPPIPPNPPTTPAALAASYSIGDQILLVSSSGVYATSFTVTATPTVTPGGQVWIQHTPTTAGGTGIGGVSASPSDDPLGIALAMIGDPQYLPPKPPPPSGPIFTLGTQYCPTGTADLAYKLTSITYSVDAATDPTNPKLVRTQGGVKSVIAEQIIGFKVGASTWNKANDSPYDYDSKLYFKDWHAIRAVRVSVIGRTPPNSDVNNKFRNGFDNGPYRVESVSVVINPRNLSMND